MMDKKGVDISINVIIVAAIALAVLVILFAITTGRLGIFTGGIRSTDTCKQKCDSLNMVTDSATNEQGCSSPRQYFSGKFSDVTFGVCCCRPPSSGENTIFT